MFICFFIIINEIIAQQITVTPDRPICISETVNINSEGLPASYQSIKWTFGENASPSSAETIGPHTVNYSTPGRKEIVVEIAISGIPDPFKVTKTIEISELRNEDVVRNIMFNPSSAYILNASVSVSPSSYSVAPHKYQWNIAGYYEGDLSENNQQFSYTVSADGDYNVNLYIEDAAQCNLTIDTTLTTQSVFRAPNIFTPNDDGINDAFVIESNGIRRISIEIYDRNGAIVFRPNYYANQIVWDGRNTAGMPVEPGVYFYVVAIEDDPAAQPLKGFVHIYKEQ